MKSVIITVALIVGMIGGGSYAQPDEEGRIAASFLQHCGLANVDLKDGRLLYGKIDGLVAKIGAERVLEICKGASDGAGRAYFTITDSEKPVPATIVERDYSTGYGWVRFSLYLYKQKSGGYSGAMLATWDSPTPLPAPGTGAKP